MKLEFDIFPAAYGKWQWECVPMAGVVAYSNPSSKDATERRAHRFAKALGREPVLIDEEDDDGD